MSPAEIIAAVQAFNLLEPEAQRGIVALIHVLHKKSPEAADYIAQAQKLLAQAPPIAAPGT